MEKNLGKLTVDEDDSLNARAGRVGESNAATADRASDSARSSLENVKELGARSIEKVSEAIAEGSSQVTSAGRHLEKTIGKARDYLRDTETQEMVSDAKHFVKSYPGQSIAAALVVGFFVGIALRRDDR